MITPIIYYYQVSKGIVFCLSYIYAGHVQVLCILCENIIL